MSLAGVAARRWIPASYCEAKMAETQSMDLSTLDTRKGSEQGFELTLTHPQTGAALPGRITLLGQDSAAWEDKTRELMKGRVERLARNRKNRASLEEMEAETIDQLVAVTTGWSGIVLSGEAIPFSADKARWLYASYPWIREQAYEAVNDRGNFLPRSASS